MVKNGSGRQHDFDKSVDELIRQTFGSTDQAAEQLRTVVGRRELKDTAAQIVRDLDSATLGAYAAHGKEYIPAELTPSDVSMYEVHRARWLDHLGSGVALLREIAAAALVARAFERLGVRMRLSNTDA